MANTACINAAIAGVVAYLTAEAEVCRESAPATRPTKQAADVCTTPPTLTTGGLWSGSGRIFSMQMRQLVQWRSFRRL